MIRRRKIEKVVALAETQFVPRLRAQGEQAGPRFRAGGIEGQSFFEFLPRLVARAKIAQRASPSRSQVGTVRSERDGAVQVFQRLLISPFPRIDVRKPQPIVGIDWRRLQDLRVFLRTSMRGKRSEEHTSELQS